MTKSQEIETLHSFVASLPQDSYIRPWLENVLPEVESEIRSDFIVSPSLKATRAQCDAMRANAEATCKETLNKALATSTRTISEALAKAEGIRSRLAGDLRNALRTMEG